MTLIVFKHAEANTADVLPEKGNNLIIQAVNFITERMISPKVRKVALPGSGKLIPLSRIN